MFIVHAFFSDVVSRLMADNFMIFRWRVYEHSQNIEKIYD